MDKKETIKNKLNTIFCDANQKEKKYLEVWLSDVDFGGMYRSDKYVLNVRAAHEIDGCKDEIDFIIELINTKAKEELQNIWQVNVFDTSDNVHCASNEILIYSEDTACK